MSSEESTSYPRPQSANPSPSEPVLFNHGPLAGLTVRTELREIQRAQLGRKYARKDKRPLDPPPVVVCSFSLIANNRESDLQESGIELERATMGSVCHIDLFPVPEDCEPLVAPSPPHPFTPVLPPVFAPHGPGGMFPPASYGSSSAVMQGLLPPIHFPGSDNKTGRFPHSQSSPLPGVQSLAATGAFPGYGRQQHVPQGHQHDPDIVAWFGSFAIRESSRCSLMLAGATFVQAETVDYNGKREAMFIFSDVAVKVEGTFILRFRMMNLASQIGAPPPYRVLAECFGGPFKVYSTKEFPGLPPSTALTKLLSRYSVRVNMRENERKRRKKSEIEADLASATAHPPPLAGPSGAGAAQSSPPRAAQYSPTMSVGSSHWSEPYPGPYAVPLTRSGGARTPRSPRGRGFHPRGGSDEDDSGSEDFY